MTQVILMNTWLECPLFFSSFHINIYERTKGKRTFRPGTFLKGHSRLLPSLDDV
jgi:hypothetical protein